MQIQSDLVQVLLTGHTKGIPVLRVEDIGRRRVVVKYDPFSLKAITMIGGRVPAMLEVLLSRCISIKMLRYPKSWVKPKKRLKPEVFQSVRSKMYMYRLSCSDVMNKRYEELLARDDLKINHRARDNALPLLATASLISQELYGKVLKYLEETEEETSGEDDWTKVAYDVIVEHGAAGTGHDQASDQLLQRKAH
jgi:hypothetical protein